jgi:uncharacterized membrane protein
MADHDDDEDAVSLRLSDLEAQMGRMFRLSGDILREQDRTNAIVHTLQTAVGELQTWTEWLNRFTTWLCNTIRDFPWP